MKLKILQIVMYTAWLLDDLTDMFVEWAQIEYGNEVQKQRRFE